MEISFQLNGRVSTFTQLESQGAKRAIDTEPIVHDVTCEKGNMAFEIEGSRVGRLDLRTMESSKLESNFFEGILMQEFEIQSMSCGGCAGHVTRAVRNLDAQAKVEVDLKSKTVRISTTEDRLSVVAALTEAGYPPK